MFPKLNKFFAGKDVKVHECGPKKDAEKPSKKHDRFMTVMMIALAGSALTPMAVQKYLEVSAAREKPQAKTEYVAAPKMPTKESVLAGAFETHSITEQGDTLLTYNFLGDSVSLSRAQKLVNLVMETKTGSDVLKHMADNNCVLMLQPADSTELGFFTPSLNAIVLNSIFSDDLLAATLVHEGKHAQQVHSSGYSLDFTYDKESVITLGRAMEGDAVMTQTQFAFELLEACKPESWIALRNQKPEVVDAFLGAMIKYDRDPEKVSRETMLAWYKDRNYVGMYEVQYATGMARALKASDDMTVGTLFARNIPTDSIASRICVYNGRKYMGTDGSALLDSTTHYLHRETRDFLDRVDGEYARRTGATFSVVPGSNAKSDPSHRTFHVVEQDGRLTPPDLKKENPKTAVAKTAVAKTAVAKEVAEVKTAQAGNSLHFLDAVRMMRRGNSGK